MAYISYNHMAIVVPNNKNKFYTFINIEYFEHLNIVLWKLLRDN